MSKQIVAAVVAEIQRRGAKPLDEENCEDVLVLDDLQMRVDPPDETWIGALLVFLIDHSLPDDPRVYGVVAKYGYDLAPTMRCHVDMIDKKLFVWLDVLVGPRSQKTIPAIIDEAIHRAKGLSTRIDEALDTAGGPPEGSPPTRGLAELLGALDHMVGLDAITAQIRELIAARGIAERRAAAGLKVEPLSPHLVFTGNPGTGKTTVARLIGEIYAALKILPKGQVVEVERSQLVARYVGQTAPKTLKAIEKAMGGILFVDEAYSLSQSEASEDFGPEAIETLMTAMENRRGQFAVIVAGYPAEMERFLASNPGLESRFDTRIHFRDYTTDELVEIFRRRAVASDYDLAPGFIERLRVVLASTERGANFANARAVRRLFYRVRACQEARLHPAGKPTVEALRLLLPSDIPDATRSPRRMPHGGYL